MPETEQTYTRKPKRRLRLGRWMFALIVVLVGGHWYWGHLAWRSFQEEVARLQAAGEPVMPEDFRRREFIDGPNAAVDLDAAAAIISDGNPRGEAIWWPPTTLPAPPEAWPYLEEAVAWYEPALRRIDVAVTKPRCAWQHMFQHPVINLGLPELNRNISLADLLRCSAHIEHHRGNDSEALRRLNQLLFVSRACTVSPMSGYAASLRIAYPVTEYIEQVAPELRSASDKAIEAEIRSLIGSLLDDRSYMEGLLLATRSHRLVSVSFLDNAGRGQMDAQMPMTSLVGGYVMRPLFYRTANAVLEQHELVSKVAGDADWPSAKANLHAIPEVEETIPVADLLSFIRGLLQSHFQAMTDRRLAATALAIRLYMADHDGNLPCLLDELVPNYLPSVPRDPMAPDRRTIGYVNRSEHPVLYSVGKNGVDDAASEAVEPDASPGEKYEWDRLDRVYYLTRRVREIPSVPYPSYAGPYGLLGVPGEPSLPPWERDRASSQESLNPWQASPGPVPGNR